MATFDINTDVIFHIVNHTNNEFIYSLKSIGMKEPEYSGPCPPNRETVVKPFSIGGRNTTLEYGNVVIVYPVPNNSPGIRFWSGFDGPLGKHNQYINLIAGNGWNVTRDTDEISELTGNGFRVTIDGGGANNPKLDNIYIQVYNH